MYCNNCGNANAEGKFCDICGAELNNDFGATELLQEPVYTAPNYASDAAPAAPKDPGKTLGKVGMILGIVGASLGVLCCFFNVYGICFPFGVAGLILSIIGSKKSKNVGIANGNAKIGLITSIAALALYILNTIIFIVIYALGLSASLMSY